MKKLIACLFAISLLVTFSTSLIANEFSGNIEFVKATKGNLKGQIDSLLKSNFAGNDQLWFGIKVTVREEMKTVKFGHHNIFRNGRSISFGEDDEGLERIGSQEKGAILCYRKSGKSFELNDLIFIEYNDEYKFKTKTFWLEDVDADDSYKLTETLFDSTANDDLKEDICLLIGLHHGEKPLAKLESIIKGNYHLDVREEAVNWFAFASRDFKRIQAVEKYLNHEDLREEIVQAYYFISTKESLQHLFTMAKTDKFKDVREEALMWLGFKARDILGVKRHGKDDDPEYQMKKKAIFSLSQMDNQKGAKALLQIARSSDNPKLRAEAIFWLSQEGNKEVLEVLEEIIF